MMSIDESDRVAREAMLRPLFEEPVDIERESAWDGPKGFLIGGMMRGTIQETAHQYINAANVIINAIKHDEIEDFRLAHPALFLYRHAVELMLKAVVPNAGKVHHLDKLADRFKDFVKAGFGEDVPGWLMDRLRELAQIDPNSTAFRYAHEGISGDELHVDLAHLQRTMAILQDVFDRVYEVASSRRSCGPLLRRRHDQKQL
jgi:hypothetical protein